MSRDVIFILFGARTGSSALTRVLSLAGCTLPESVLAPRDMNPKGFWEPVDATKLNAEFLMQHGVRMTDPSMALEVEIQEAEKEDFIGKVQSFLGGCPPGPALVIKCGGVIELFDFWSEAARRSGFSVKIVIPVRRPQEALASFAAAGTLQSPESLSALWLKAALLAEHVSRGFPRVFVEYANLLKDWRTEIARVARALSIELRPDTAIGSFLTPDLHRQRSSGPIIETFGQAWMSRVYSILSAAAQDGPIDFSALDEIYHAYRINERTFRIAWENSRSLCNDVQVFRQAFDQFPTWTQGRDF